MQDELPDAPPQDHQHPCHDRDSYPAGAGARLFTSAVPAHIFCKLDPVVFRGVGCAGFAQGIVKTLKPGSLIESHGHEIAANDTFAEDTTGKLGVPSTLQR